MIIGFFTGRFKKSAAVCYVTHLILSGINSQDKDKLCHGNGRDEVKPYLGVVCFQIADKNKIIDTNDQLHSFCLN